MARYALGLYEKAMPGTMTIGDKLECAKECGYDYVELSVDETDEKLARLDWTKEERLALVKEMYRVGLPLRSMCLSGHRKYPFGASFARQNISFITTSNWLSPASTIFSICVFALEYVHSDGVISSFTFKNSCNS